MPYVMQYKPIGEDEWYTEYDENGDPIFWYEGKGAEQTARDRTKYNVDEAKWRAVEADGSI